MLTQGTGAGAVRDRHLSGCRCIAVAQPLFSPVAQASLPFSEPLPLLRPIPWGWAHHLALFLPPLRLESTLSALRL